MGIKKIVKQYLLISLVCFCAPELIKAQIQIDPAHWAYGLKRISANTYEVHLQCKIDSPWHIYAQKQTKDFIGTATKISMNKVPGLTLVGIPVEVGKKMTYTVKEVGISNYEYAGKVDFVQKISLKPGVNIVSGKITYQTCTHDHCLTATSLDFSIPVR